MFAFFLLFFSLPFLPFLLFLLFVVAHVLALLGVFEKFIQAVQLIAFGLGLAKLFGQLLQRAQYTSKLVLLGIFVGYISKVSEDYALSE